MEKKLKELYQVDTISQDNSWERVIRAVEAIKEHMDIHIGDVNIIEPWNCLNFKQLLREHDIRLIFTNNKDMVNRIKVMCIFDGIDDSKVENMEVKREEKETPGQLRLARCGKELADFFKVDCGQAVFNMKDRYTQLFNPETTEVIDYAMRYIHDNQGVNKFMLNMGGINTSNSILENIADMIIRYEMDGLDLSVDTDNEEYGKNLKMFLHKSTAKTYDSRARLRAISKHLSVNEAGILIKYKKSRAVDEFGRHGHGEVVSSRMAIFLGIEGSGSNAVAVFRSFDSNYFYTRQSWMINNENEIPDSLVSNIVKMKLDEIGIGDLFIGKDYHFIKPVQRDLKESMIIAYGIGEGGRVLKKEFTIPERMKAVFDDWGIAYDSRKLMAAIEDTEREIGKTDGRY